LDSISSGIYAITHTASGKKYIGSAVNVHRRWLEHSSQLDRNKHTNSKLQNAWNKHGRDSFEFSVLEVVLNLEDLIPREQSWMDAEDVCKTGYNILAVAGSRLGMKHTDEAKAKISAASALQRHSEETKAKISAGNLGKVVTEETRLKQSLAQSTSEAAAKHRQKISADKLGTKHTPETIEKMREIKTGKTQSPETRAKISAANKGRVVSDETRAKMSAAKRLRDAQRSKSNNTKETE
jgi:group I intron endonuclease